MKALIDGDILRYYVGFSCQKTHWKVYLGDELVKEFLSKRELNTWAKTKEEEFRLESSIVLTSEEDCLAMLDEVVEGITRDAGCDNAEIYISGVNNFREEIYPEYKMNRKDAPRPQYYDLISRRLETYWGAITIEGMEADDALGMAQTDDTVIVSIDKDLDMIPGWHYNFRQEKKYHIDEVTGFRNFYTQLITGDVVDNIPGLSEKAPKKRTYTTSPLEEMDDAHDMRTYVYIGYTDKYGEDADAQYELNAKLLWIRRGNEQDRMYVSAWEPLS